MFISPLDDTLGPDEWRPFVDAQGFGHLVAGGGPEREVPVVVPTQFLLDGDEVVIHLARPNPVWAAVAENPRVLLSVAGDWAFVPSAWKAIGDEDPRRGIPTTYYGAVQLVGPATVLDGPEAMAALLRRQLRAFQPEVEVDDPSTHERRLGAIRGLVVAIDQVRAKFKYGGNVDQPHRLAVADRLRARAGPGDLAAADHLVRRLEA